ncbi:hypothetical protein A9R01_01215 ['Osedax' symbiont bacterium Rs2_46_30_T18]|nr:hypothetical protein A9R01_01215 ['Osedax' symbiont bacterium Rs2_46_30_T18]
MLNTKCCISFLSCLISCTQLGAVEFKANGIVDFRLSHNDTSTSYLQGGYGKFSSDSSAGIALSQIGGQFSATWDSGVSANLVLNGYSEEGESRAGVTEAYVKYKSLPSASGYRWENRTGLFYPHISLENRAFAWASVNTLNSSTLNTWLGEEIRLLGSEIKLTRLGKMHGDPYDVSLTTSVFGNNDPAAALLAWHGWTSSNRQTFWGQARAFPQGPAQQTGQVLEHQDSVSKPYLELDDRLGYLVQLDWRQHRKGHILFGYYDNRALPFIVENGQYGWDTNFAYASAAWKLAPGLQLSAQYLAGTTLMQMPSGEDVVNNSYSSAFVALSKQLDKHKFSVRVEEFSVTDRDQQVRDNNDEYGRAATVNYTYRLTKPWFLSAEYSVIKSNRPSREYLSQPAKLTEQQLQFAARYFF